MGSRNKNLVSVLCVQGLRPALEVLFLEKPWNIFASVSVLSLSIICVHRVEKALISPFSAPLLSSAFVSLRPHPTFLPRVLTGR